MIGSATLNLPLKPYLAKYLTQKFGTEHQVSYNSWLGSYIIDILNKEYRKKASTLSTKASYHIIVPSSIIKNYGFEITETKMLRLEKMIEKVFRNDIYSYIEVSIGSELTFVNKTQNSINKQNAVKAISQFLKFYDILEDELSSETIYRDFYRYKKTDKTIKSKTKELV